jgi:uncharacterized protein (UPF0548 family)
MLFLRKPSQHDLEVFLIQQRDAALSYAPLGCTSAQAPPGYVRDHERTVLGSGREVFQAACDALRAWKMFDLRWTSVVDPACPVVAGREVGVLARVGFLWTLNACRILEVVDRPGRCFGFVYGTLDEHVERGEERFLVELDSANRVWFDLFAISRPHRWYARIASPVARCFQRRFRRDAAAAMLRAAQSVPNRAQGG